MGEHRWKLVDPPPEGQRYVERSWGYACCVHCRAQRFFHESGPKGGVYVTYTWPRGHRPSMPGTPKAYITLSAEARKPPCLHVVA